AGMSGSISGFTFADRLVLEGVTSTSATYDSTTHVLSVGSLSFTVSGIASGFIPQVSAATASSTELSISFVAATTSDARPGIFAPATLRGGVSAAVLVPDVVLQTPLVSGTS